MKFRVFLSILFLAVFILPTSTACSSTVENSVTIGIITTAASMETVIEGFKTAMAENGYIEGKNITYIYNGPKTDDALTREIAFLMEQNIDLILSLASPATLAVQVAVAGTDIPVVYAPINDPVGVGLANSIREPGNNMTGIETGDFSSKELEWLLRITPEIKKIYAPYNPADPAAAYGYSLLKIAAEKLNVTIIAPEVSSQEEIAGALDNIPDDVGAIFMTADSLVLSNFENFLAVARAKNLPLASIGLPQVEAGALLAYGPEFNAVGRQAAHLADQIIKNSDAGSLPVEDAEHFLFINQKVATDLGIDFPDEVLKAAKEIIR